MGRCGWGVGVALILAVLGASCGGTGGGPSDSGDQFVFTARGRLILSVQTVGAGVSQGCQSSQAVSDPKRLLLTATLLDPQGVPFRNQRITFTAEFPDATFIPGNDNQGSVLTDDSGQASITLVAGLKLGKMRVIAEASAALNISTGITVTLTEQGFLSQGPLGIIPSAVTFVNPAPHPPGGPADFTFQATGGDPPYKFSNSNSSVGKIETIGTCGSLGQYTLTGPLPTKENEDALKDTVTVQDESGARAQADVQVLFVACSLNVSPTTIDIGGAVGGERADITITNGVPPFTVTHTFPIAGNLLINQNTGIVTFIVAKPPVGVSPDTILIRDSRNCTATVDINITPAAPQTVTTFVLTANPDRINGVTGGTSTITALVLDENSKPIQGLPIFFVTDKGSITLTATTNSNGQATAILTIPAQTPAGMATVTGFAGGKTASVVVTIFTGGPGGGPPANIFIDLFANRSGDNNDGTCTTVLSALVVDAIGNPVNDGTPVFWAASPAITLSGGSAAVAISSPSFTNQPAPCDTSSYEAATASIPGNGKITPQPGNAITCLKYPQSAGGGTVGIAAASGAASNTRAITLPPCPFAPPGTPVIFPSSVTLAPGESRTFIVVGGIPPYDIAASGGGTVNPNQVAASGGSFSYTAGTQTGDFEIFAIDAANAQAAPATVHITATSAQVAAIVLEANPPSVNGITGGISTITASVFNENNQPIQGVSVLFETDTGTISPLTATTNASGQASTTLTILSGTPAKVAAVSASAGGKSDSVDVQIVTSSPGTAGPPANIFVDLFAANRSGDNNDGTCTTIVSALVVDDNGNPVSNGTKVTWAIQAGSASSSVTSPSFTNQDPPCNTSSYTDPSTGTGIPITPQPGDALTCLKYPQSSSGGIVTVTATSGTVGPLPFPITLPPCPSVKTIVLTASPGLIQGATGGTSTITATALNVNNQPLPNVTIAFTATIGTLSSLTKKTNSSGQAQVTLTIDPMPSGTAATTTTVKGTAPGGIFGPVDITITAVP
jgi:hypothetical protein